MRPDEHKKRKNTQYKKKHGIPNKADNVEKDAKKNQNDKRQKDKPCGKDEKQKADKEIKGKTKEETVSDVQPEYDDFRRRKLVSNWSRYDDSDDNDDDDIPTQRGEEFNKLLMEAGGSAAQFRLKDEEDWTEDVHDSGDSILALDLENLAESLSCIPLHNRLCIDQKYLSDEQIIEIKAVASTNEEKYNLKYPKGLKETNFQSLDESEQIGETGKGNEMSNESIKNEIITTDNTLKEPSRLTQGKEPCSDICINKTETHSKDKSSEIMSLEDDLDALLSLDEPNTPKAVANSDDGKCNKPAINSNSAIKLDKSTKILNTDTADLEDWLDSVLDE